MKTTATTHTSDDIDLMLDRAQRFNRIIDHIIFSKGCPTDAEGWCELADDLYALNHAIEKELSAARLALESYVKHVTCEPPEPESSSPSVPSRTKPSSKVAEPAQA